MIVDVSLEEVRHVVEILNESYRGGEGWTTERGLVSGDRATEQLIRAEMEAGYKYFLHQEGSGFIGCFNLNKKSETVEIGGLGVKAGYQGKGYGKKLLRHAEAEARKLSNTSRLIVSVLEPREELIRFYLRRGYHLTEELYPFPQHRGVGVPLIENLQVIVLEKKI